jgi:BMFP domain-containing protein YqiC
MKKKVKRNKFDVNPVIAARRRKERNELLLELNSLAIAALEFTST